MFSRFILSKLAAKIYLCKKIGLYMNFRIVSSLLACVIILSVSAENFDNDNKFNYIPEIHGTLRPRYELEPDNMDQRFQVRNARLSLEGGICPVISYRFQTDFCDCGKFKVLDAWARIAMSDNFSVTAGQTLMPFSIEAVRSPHLYYFANKSFVSTGVGASRGVGAKFAYRIPRLPLALEAGIFNNATISDHEVWQKDLAYTAKIRYAVGEVGIEGGFKSAAPDSVRINMADMSVTWAPHRWVIEGEYLYKHYTHRSFRPSHAYSAFASYWHPVRVGVFNRVSVQGRWDGMTDHSSGKRDNDGALFLTDAGRNRLTVGATLSYVYSKVRADVRVNYENYFYHSGVKVKRGEHDKIIVELVVRF